MSQRDQPDDATPTIAPSIDASGHSEYVPVTSDNLERLRAQGLDLIED